MQGNFLVLAPGKMVNVFSSRPGGPARCGRRTKDLAKRLVRGDVAVILHRDLDYVAAEALAERQVSFVVNLFPSISGRYPNRGPSILLERGIPLLDIDAPGLLDRIPEGARLELEGESLFLEGEKLASGELQTHEVVAQKLEVSRRNLDQELQSFARNTIEHASRELTHLLAPTNPPPTKTRIRERHVLIVVRGEGFKDDLDIIRGYLASERPVLIGVDGGADALLEIGLKPDIIVGDMDSVSDRALHCGAEIVVHTYPDGRSSPGLERVKELGLEHLTFPVAGTSEDVAMLLAFEHGAELLVAVGTHSNLYDFLDKGREGMASTILVRMRIGSRLVDAKGVSKLYASARKPWRDIILLLSVGLLLAGLILQQSQPVQNWLESLMNSIRLQMLQWRIGG